MRRHMVHRESVIAIQRGSCLFAVTSGQTHSANAYLLIECDGPSVTMECSERLFDLDSVPGNPTRLPTSAPTPKNEGAKPSHSAHRDQGHNL